MFRLLRGIQAAKSRYAPILAVIALGIERFGLGDQRRKFRCPLTGTHTLRQARQELCRALLARIHRVETVEELFCSLTSLIASAGKH